MNYQQSLFDGAQPFKIDKPIRLIELFAGYGSQALALKYLGVNFQSWKIAEWAIKSIQAYKDLHYPQDSTDYAKDLSDAEVQSELLRLGISQDYSAPMDAEKIKRLGNEKSRQIYNNIKATNNLVSVCNIHTSDLEITDTNNYCYILTYSFPCQDLSQSGKREGMSKGSGTRSGLLWEVERLLNECVIGGGLPQVLLMENVSAILNQKNIANFAEWVAALDKLGYKSKWQIMNACDYGVPQNRERCFMVSVLGDYYFDFPPARPSTLRLKDVLEQNVDKKNYLKADSIKVLINHAERNKSKGCGFGWQPSEGDGLAHCLDTSTKYRSNSNFIIEPVAGGGNIRRGNLFKSK